MTTRRRYVCLAALLVVAGCNRIGSGSSATTMRNVEILPGTASDEMVTLDQASGEGTAIDASTAVGPADPNAPSPASDSANPANAPVDGDAAPATGDGGPAPATDGAAPDAKPAGDSARPDDVIIRPPAPRPALRSAARAAARPAPPPPAKM